MTRQCGLARERDGGSAAWKPDVRQSQTGRGSTGQGQGPHRAARRDRSSEAVTNAEDGKAEVRTKGRKGVHKDDGAVLKWVSFYTGQNEHT